MTNKEKCGLAGIIIIIIGLIICLVLVNSCKSKDKEQEPVKFEHGELKPALLKDAF